ncbi:hypothetical protein TL16_g12059 [Triparma laevis f. inornata]|uniref:EF-hand domain-containing protein n=1 Tax=Triparma laevis f. inornata TaxID=1714386 RepID=A0A9W7BHX0_9STRA|nr:hypothetical protein TL16_g12059 [Triparma laevis f. inornata]
MEIFIEMDKDQDDYVDEREFVEWQVKVFNAYGNNNVDNVEKEKEAKEEEVKEDSQEVSNITTSSDVQNLTLSSTSISSKIPLLPFSPSSPSNPSVVVSEDNVVSSIRLEAKRIEACGSRVLEEERGGGRKVDVELGDASVIKRGSSTLKSTSSAKSTVKTTVGRKNTTTKSLSNNISQQLSNSTTFFPISEPEEEDVSTFEPTNASVGSTSSLTNALLSAHRKNKFLEEELKREKEERKGMMETVRGLKEAVRGIQREGQEEEAEESMYSLNQTTESIKLLELRANRAEQIAETLQEQLGRAAVSLRDMKEKESEERKSFMKDIEVLSRSQGLMSDETTVVEGTRRENMAAKIAVLLQKSLGEAEIEVNDLTAKACVDAAMNCISEVAGFGVVFSLDEEDLKNSRERLEVLNGKLETEMEVMKSTSEEVTKLKGEKIKWEEEVLEVEREKREGRSILERIKREVKEEEIYHKHNLEKHEREVEMVKKRINGEKERLSILKSEVDGEDTHLKELRKVAEAEFGALQKNVEGLAKKANCVKEDIAEKRLIVERLKDKIGHLEDVKSGTQNDHEEQGMRHEKELGRLRSEIGRTEEQLSDLREEVSTRRFREDDRMESFKADLYKIENRIEAAREEQKVERRSQEEKRRRWQGDIEGLKKEFKERQALLDSLRTEIEDGNIRVSVTTRSVNDLAHRVTELNGVIENKADELKSEIRRKEAIDAEIESQLLQMEEAVKQGKIVAEKLRSDSDILSRLEAQIGEKLAEQDGIDMAILERKEGEVEGGKALRSLEAEIKRREGVLAKLEDSIVEAETKGEEVKDLESKQASLQSTVAELESSSMILQDKVAGLHKSIALLSGENSGLSVKKDSLEMSLNRLEGETSSNGATLAAIQKQIAASKGVEATVSGHLNDMRESLAVTEGKKRALENKVDDVNSTLRSRENELREVERLLGVAKARRDMLERESVRVERDVKEKRQLENELHVLRSSRDLAAGEAMKAEEESLAVREQLRDLEARMVRAKGGLRGARGGAPRKREGYKVLSPGQKIELVGGNVDVMEYIQDGSLGGGRRGGGGGRRGWGGGGGGREDENLRILKEKIDNVSVKSFSGSE